MLQYVGYEVHPASLNPITFWHGFFLDLGQYWHGAPMLLDLDGTFGTSSLNVYLNRFQVFCVAPYFVLGAIILAVAFFSGLLSAVKLAAACAQKSSWRGAGGAQQGRSGVEKPEEVHPRPTKLSAEELRKLEVLAPVSAKKPNKGHSARAPPARGGLFDSLLRSVCPQRFFPRVESTQSIASTVSTAVPPPSRSDFRTARRALSKAALPSPVGLEDDVVADGTVSPTTSTDEVGSIQSEPVSEDDEMIATSTEPTTRSSRRESESEVEVVSQQTVPVVLADERPSGADAITSTKSKNSKCLLEPASEESDRSTATTMSTTAASSTTASSEAAPAPALTAAIAKSSKSSCSPSTRPSTVSTESTNGEVELSPDGREDHSGVAQPPHGEVVSTRRRMRLPQLQEESGAGIDCQRDLNVEAENRKDAAAVLAKAGQDVRYFNPVYNYDAVSRTNDERHRADVRAELAAKTVSPRKRNLGNSEESVVSPISTAASTIASSSPPKLASSFVAGSEAVPSASSSGPAVPGKEQEERPTWTIYGRKYDLTKFMESHPGGKWPLTLTKNSDCTILFESYHPFVPRDKLEKMMIPYEIREPGVPKRLQLPPQDPLHADLHQFARDFFAERRSEHEKKLSREGVTMATKKAAAGAASSPRAAGMSSKPKIGCATVGRPHNMTVGVCALYSALYLGCWACVYYFLRHASLTAAILFPVLQWTYGASLSHDSSHFAAFPNDTINRIGSWIGGFPLMFNASAWSIQHVIQHHQFTNLIDDVDLFHFRPLVRASRLFDKPEGFLTKVQGILIFLILPTTSLHLHVAVPLDLLLSIPVFIGPFDKNVKEEDKMAFRYGQCRHLKSLMKDLWWPMAAELALQVLWLVAGVWILGPFQYIVLFAPMIFVASWSFLIFTQGAHINKACMENVEANADLRLRKGVTGVHPYEITGFEGSSTQKLLKLSDEDLQKTEHPNPMMGRWIREQVAYTSDFCVDSYGWYLISGGLNMQSIHHVIPGISHSHYTAMYPGFKKVLEKHGIKNREVATFRQFVSQFFEWLHELGNVEGKEELDWAHAQYEAPARIVENKKTQ